jgi:hypothetical protein
MGTLSKFKGGGQNKSGKETRGCRFYNLNYKQNCISKLKSCLHLTGECKQEFKYVSCFTSEEKFWPSRPHVGGGIFYTEFIQICTISVVDFDKKHHIHQIL